MREGVGQQQAARGRVRRVGQENSVRGVAEKDAQPFQTAGYTRASVGAFYAGRAKGCTPMIEISLDKSAIGAVAREMPLGAPCFMLNLLRYREMADYGVDGSREPACTGREAYFGRYVPAFTIVFNY